MDFRNVTNIADPDFDGDPVMIKQASENDDLTGAEDETNNETIIDELDGEESNFQKLLVVEKLRMTQNLKKSVSMELK